MAVTAMMAKLGTESLVLAGLVLAMAMSGGDESNKAQPHYNGNWHRTSNSHVCPVIVYPGNWYLFFVRIAICILV